MEITKEDFIKEIIPRTVQGTWGNGTDDEKFVVWKAENPNAKIFKTPDGRVMAIR